MSKLEDEKNALQSNLINANNHIVKIEEELRNLAKINKEL